MSTSARLRAVVDEPAADAPRLGPNDVEPCPSEGCRRRHLAHGNEHVCDVQMAECSTGDGRPPGRQRPPLRPDSPAVEGRMVRATLPQYLLETLQACADGLESADMAVRLCIGVDTARHRISKLYEVLGARNRAHAVAIGYRLGLLNPEPLPLPDVLQADGAPLSLLIAAREDRGRSMAAAAEPLGRSAGWLLAREHGRLPFPLKELLQHAANLGVHLDLDPAIRNAA